MALLQKGYLGATPLFRDVAWLEAFAPKYVQLSGNTTVTADAAANTKGSWAPLIASTTANASLLHLVVTGVNTSSTDTATLLDIGTGAAGAETVAASEIAVGGANNLYIVIPLKIASGTRLSARIQSVVTGGKTANITTNLLDVGDYATAPTSVDVYGSGANSQGASFSGSSGQWSLATASTTRAYRGVVLVPSMHDSNIANVSNTVMEVGVGAAGAEISFGSTINTYVNQERAESRGILFPYFGRNIPAGSRLAVRHNIAADPSKYGFCLIGIP
jgi:hypothetical protein